MQPGLSPPPTERYSLNTPAAGAVLYAKDMEQVAAFYAAVLDLRTAVRDFEHIRLEGSALELVVRQVLAPLAAQIAISSPPARRENAAIKPVFFVPSLAQARTTAAVHRGALNGSEREWMYESCRVCDGVDPEGNVLQFRELVV